MQNLKHCCHFSLPPVSCCCWDSSWDSSNVSE